MRRTETPKPIWLKFCTVVDIPDAVTYTNFGDHRLRGFWVARGQISPSPIDFHRRPYNTLALPCERVIRIMLSLLTLTADIVDTVLTANNVLQYVAKFTMHSARMPNVLFIVTTKHDGCICQIRSLGDTWAVGHCITLKTIIWPKAYQLTVALNCIVYSST